MLKQLTRDPQRQSGPCPCSSEDLTGVCSDLIAGWSCYVWKTDAKTSHSPREEIGRFSWQWWGQLHAHSAIWTWGILPSLVHWSRKYFPSTKCQALGLDPRNMMVNKRGRVPLFVGCRACGCRVGTWRERSQDASEQGSSMRKDIFKNWSVVDLQRCVNFYCLANWLSYIYIYI